MYGNFIVPQDDNGSTSIFTASFNLTNGTETSDSEIALYKVNETGYYCVAIMSTDLKNDPNEYFGSWIEWRMPYGNLPAADYPKLLVCGRFANEVAKFGSHFATP